MAKKLKKLVLNKEVITRIKDNQMNRLWGGMDATCQGDGGGGGSGSPEYSQVRSGCSGETCGTAYTCNGR